MIDPLSSELDGAATTISTAQTIDFDNRIVLCRLQGHSHEMLLWQFVQAAKPIVWQRASLYEDIP